jgi:hypothetical protein
MAPTPAATCQADGCDWGDDCAWLPDDGRDLAVLAAEAPSTKPPPASSSTSRRMDLLPHRPLTGSLPDRGGTKGVALNHGVTVRVVG